MSYFLLNGNSSIGDHRASCFERGDFLRDVNGKAIEVISNNKIEVGFTPNPLVFVRRGALGQSRDMLIVSRQPVVLENWYIRSLLDVDHIVVTPLQLVDNENIIIIPDIVSVFCKLRIAADAVLNMQGLLVLSILDISQNYSLAKSYGAQAAESQAQILKQNLPMIRQSYCL